MQKAKKGTVGMSDINTNLIWKYSRNSFRGSSANTVLVVEVVGELVDAVVGVSSSRDCWSMCPKIQISTTWGRWDGN